MVHLEGREVLAFRHVDAAVARVLRVLHTHDFDELSDHGLVGASVGRRLAPFTTEVAAALRRELLDFALEDVLDGGNVGAAGLADDGAELRDDDLRAAEAAVVEEGLVRDADVAGAGELALAVTAEKELGTVAELAELLEVEAGAGLLAKAAELGSGRVTDRVGDGLAFGDGENNEQEEDAATNAGSDSDGDCVGLALAIGAA